MDEKISYQSLFISKKKFKNLREYPKFAQTLTMEKSFGISYQFVSLHVKQTKFFFFIFFFIFIFSNKMITTCPAGLTYIPNLLTLEEESKVIEFLHKQIWDSSEIKRETQHFGTKYKYNKNSIQIGVPPIPQEFQFLLDRIATYTNQKFDQAIVNRYKIGEGIGAHIDDPKLYDDVVVSISLLSNIPMIFTNRKQKMYFVQVLERFSAVILEKESRYEWTHCIKSSKFDNGIARRERISITFRKMREIEQKRKQM